MWWDGVEGWGGLSSIAEVDLARLVVATFPDGIVPGTSEGIRETAYAVGSAESGRDPRAAGDRGYFFSDGTPAWSLGIWQVFLLAHPQYDPDSLLTPQYNAQAALSISSGGVNWAPWSTWNNGNYQRYLPEARGALAQAGSGSPSPGGGGGPVDTGNPSPIPSLPRLAPAQLAVIALGLAVGGIILTESGGPAIRVLR